MTLVHLGLGTNLGDRLAMLDAAVAEIGRGLVVRRVSSVYETAPWGRTDQPSFLNCCVSAETADAPRALLGRVKAIEARLGRVPGARWGPRLIDVDVLLFDDLLVDEPGLALPHPRLVERAFALVPLAEIAPDAPIPGTAFTVREALAALARTPGDVRRVSGPPARPGTAP